jgi:preprotein translocase subunit SecA
MSFLKKIFGDFNENYLKKIQPTLKRINSLEQEFEALSNDSLKEKTAELKERLKEGETLDDLLPEAFALVREAAKRTLKQRHFDVQLIGGIVLHEGKIAEMQTGEGKTLTATLPLFLNALEGKGCHLVTVNDYLARRDTIWMGQIYHLLGLSVGCLNHESSFLYDPDYKKPEKEKEKIRDEMGSFYIVEDFLRPCSRKEAYEADITYGTNNEFGFDYLRDNMVYDVSQEVQRELNYAIIDEVDSILIDEARTPLIISTPDQESSSWYREFAKIIPQLKPETDYEIDEKRRTVTLTERGIDKIESLLGSENIYEEKGMKYLHHLEQALRAQALFKRDRDYVVKDGQVIIVDEFTGRLMPGRRWSGGLHQAIEAKEGLRIQPESLTLASITFQNYFRLYRKIAGMTGTALTSAEEFDKVYGLEVIVVPTNKPMIRQDLPDRIYKTMEGKYRALVQEIKERHQKGQPLLIGTTSIEKNEYLGKLLEREGIPHQILNAKNHQKEGEIIAQAGRLGAVTIATNMAGRGVDIILGGNPPSFIEAEKVREVGGLHVIGTERHEARRIDNQLRGRAGRQGDPGSSQFFLSLEDDLMRIFGGEKVKNLMSILKIPEDQPIETKLVSRAIEEAQSKIEGFNFDLRKQVLEYDNVMNKQRELIYKKRKEFLRIENWQEEIEKWIKDEKEKELLSQKIKELGERFNEVTKFLVLRSIDSLWVNHLEYMDYLRDSVRLRAYGQQDPLVEYKNESYKAFRQLLNQLERMVFETLLKISVRPLESSLTQRVISPSFGNKKVGRNDPCPCGAKYEDVRPKKYKHCHGK